MALFIRDFPDMLRLALKVHAGKEGITLKELVIRIAAEYLDEQGGRTGNGEK